jgi:hypothetical protein
MRDRLHQAGRTNATRPAMGWSSMAIYTVFWLAVIAGVVWLLDCLP